MRICLEVGKKRNLLMQKEKGLLKGYVLQHWTFLGSGISLIELFLGLTIWPHLYPRVTIRLSSLTNLSNKRPIKITSLLQYTDQN